MSVSCITSYFLACLFMHLLVGDMVGEWFISAEKEELLTALGNSSFLFLLQQLEKCVCETEEEFCVCPLKLMACAVGKWMICTFSARYSHNENLSVQIMSNSHALLVHRSACDSREESMHSFQPLPIARGSHTLQYLPHWRTVLGLALPISCCIALAI